MTAHFIPPNGMPGFPGAKPSNRPRMTNRAVLYVKTVFREHLTEILLLIPAIATTMLTYYGISVPMGETGATVVQKGQALAFSISIGIFAWLGWFYSFGLLYRLRGSRLASALAAVVVYVGVLAAIDAPFNMMAIAGGSAVQMSIGDTAGSYEIKKDAVFSRATIAQRLLPGMRAQAERFERLEQDEIAYGVHSGRKGPGKVSSGFGQIATLIDALVRDLETGLGEARGVQDQIAARFAELKAQTYRQGAIRPRVEAATVAADGIDDLLSRLAQYDYTLSIAATLSSLERIFPVPTKSGSDFEKVQNTELGVIAEMAKPVATSLNAALDELRALPTIEAPRMRPQNAHEAIRTYWRPLLPEWCAALFIDLAPAALLIILIAAWREHDRPDADKSHGSTPSSGPARPSGTVNDDTPSKGASQ